MALPILMAGAGMVGSLIGQVAGGIVSRAVNTAIDPILLTEKYAAQTFWRTSVPSIAEGIQAYMYGDLDSKDFSSLCNINNQIFDDQAQHKIQSFSKKTFKHFVNAVMPKLSLEQLIYCYYSGIITEPTFKLLSKQFKLVNGHQEPLANMLYAKFDMGTILTCHFRKIWADGEPKERVRRLYGCSSKHADDILNASRYIPPPTDLLRFVVRGVYDKDEIETFKLDAEYDTVSKAKVWAEALGLGTTTVGDKNNPDNTRDLLKDYWMAHWNLISPQQGMEAFHRVRENRLNRFDQRIEGLKPFDWKQLNTLLKAQDYVPEQRKWLAAISTKIIGRIDLRRLYNSGTIDSIEMREQILDQGYNEPDAIALGDWMESEKDKKDKKEKEDKDKKNNAKLVTQIYGAYQDGIIDSDKAYTSLTQLGIDDIEAYHNLQAIDIQINRARVKTYIKMVKGEFMMGLYTGQEAYVELVSGGIEQIRANQYAIQWQRVLDRPRRSANIQTVITWYKDGYITLDNTRTRLSNLGLSNADTFIYIHAADVDIRKAMLLEEAKRTKSTQQAQRESDRLMRQAISDRKASISTMKQYRSLTQLRTWWNEGLISASDIIETLNYYMIPQPDIDKYLTEWGVNGE